ncbi:UvrB/UvrC motif-containing protein [Candidatus Woesearchaeota archaeon]|nr:UvrB/UvrC motif-containing protein [Candidatus Woesearchaeota archaeon]
MGESRAYKVEKDYGEFQVVLFGREGPESCFDIRLKLKPTPLQELASGLERYCTEQGIDIHPGLNFGAGTDEGRHERKEYHLQEGKLEVLEFSHNLPSRLNIEGTKDNAADAIKEAKTSYQRLRAFVQSLGYDTSEFDSYIDSFGLSDLREHPWTPPEVHYVDIGMLNPDKPGEGREAQLRGTPNFYGGIAEQAESGLGALLRDTFKGFGLLGDGSEMDTTFAKAIAGLRKEKIRFNCPDCNQTHMLNRKGTPDGTPSLYSRIVQEEAETGEQKELSPVLVNALMSEATLYSYRIAAFEGEKNYKGVSMDVERVIRILDYLIEHLPDTKKMEDIREKALNGRAKAEIKRAKAGAELALKEGDFERALRCYSRAKEFMRDFYTNVHKLEPTAEFIEMHVRRAYEIVNKDSSLELGIGLQIAIESEMERIKEFLTIEGLPNKSTEYSPSELTLDQQIPALEAELEELVKREEYEQAARVRDNIKAAKEKLDERQREDPLELEKRYVHVMF